MAMNSELTRLAETMGLQQPCHEALRLAFGLACVRRVQHLLEDPRALDGLAALEAFLEGRLDRAGLEQAAQAMAAVAAGHRGSSSIDGTAHAAVSATYAVAKATAGRALEAASYAAYASVYAYSGHAVNDPSAFGEEFRWQISTFEKLAQAPAPADCSSG
jgi:hypothetical protein